MLSLEDAFGFILLLDSNVTTKTLTDVENYPIFPSFEELRASLAEASSNVQSKPVIILSSDAPPRDDHLIVAGSEHWKHGGKYVLSRVKCRYLAKTGKLQIDAVQDLDICRLALLPAVLTMPVSESLLRDSQHLLFVPSGEFTICVPHARPDDEAIRRLEQIYEGAIQTPAELERLAKTGALNHVVLQQLDRPANGPVSHFIAARTADHRRLNLVLEDERLPESEIAAAISLIEKSWDDLVYIPEKLAGFLAALASRTDTLPNLELSTLHSFVTLSRQCAKTDEIAAALAPIADQLCRKDPRLISPLFELLANSLSADALNATYSFVAAELLGVETHCIRLAQSMQRFADESTLALFLANLHRTHPRWLGKRSLARCFQPLLASPLLPALAAEVGEDAIAKISDVVSVTDQFRASVRAGDRLLAKEMLNRSDELSNIDFARWMNDLRGLSHELGEMVLPIADLDVPAIQDLEWRKLAAIIFGDREAIHTMAAAGHLNNRDELNAIALSMTANNAMLNEIVEAKFAETGFSPMKLDGNTVTDVLANADRSVVASHKIDGPLVSVIMTAYNPAIDLMDISLRSIGNQTWKNVELILVDDASEPAATSIEKLAAAHDYVKTIRVDVNSGPYVGRNLALRHARGEFIAIQDADDWSHPQRLAAQVDYLLRTPEAQAVTTEHIRINRAGHVALEGGFRMFGQGPMTSLFRAGIFDKIGAFAAIRSRGDLEMHERIAAYYGCQANAVLPVPMALCLADSKTLSRNTAARSAQHLQLFRTNLSHRHALTSLFRDGVPLRRAHQLSVPMMLRAPEDPPVSDVNPLRDMPSRLSQIDPTRSWEMLTEDRTTSGSHWDGSATLGADYPEIAADVAAAHLIATNYLGSASKQAGTGPHAPLRVDRASLLEAIGRTYDGLGLRQALARIFIHAETSDDQSKAMEALAQKVEKGDREAATSLYQLSYDLDPSSARARKLAARMFQNGDVTNASRLLELTSDPDSGSTVIANLRLAITLRSGIIIPPRAAVQGKAELDVAYVAAETLPFSSSGYAVRTHQTLRSLGGQGLSSICYGRPGFPFDRTDSLARRDGTASDVAFDDVNYSFSWVAPVVDRPESYIERLSGVLEKQILSSKPAVVHAASNYMNALPALIAARRTGRPFIYEVRGLWELSAAARRPNWEGTDRFRLDREMETLVASNADHVLAITQGVADQLIAGGVPPDRISLLPNAVDPERFRPRPPDRDLAAKFTATGDFTLVYAGSLNAYEGLDDLVTAIAQLRRQGRNARLIIVGDGAASLHLQNQVAELGMQTAVAFVGRVPPDEVLRYLSLADAVTIPRKPFPVCNIVPPLKPFEAMAMGKPVVLTDLPALREIVQHDATGLLTAPEDPQDLARALARLADDPELRARLGDAGRRWVVQERSWSANAQLLKRLYASVV